MYFLLDSNAFIMSFSVLIDYALFSFDRYGLAANHHQLFYINKKKSSNLCLVLSRDFFNHQWKRFIA